MLEFVEAHETLVRLGVFGSALLVFLVLEFITPRRKTNMQRGRRWVSNFSIVALNAILLNITGFLVGVSAAVLAENYGWGIFNNIGAPQIVAILGSIIILDLAIYWQHRIFHEVPVLWRLHRLHHSDVEYDVSTALRFHPVEIIMSYFIKFAVTLVLGAPLVALIIFEIILNAAAMFNHSNLNIPQSLDKILRTVLVTPDMHRVHHSVHIHEANSNYGFNISVWDRLFGSYTAQPKDGHLDMQIGMSRFRESKEQTLGALLGQPLK
jgi:sterol desaturase/sphingolipid hydroxylase (fatty acid hydroxylase superfamily)